MEVELKNFDSESEEESEDWTVLEVDDVDPEELRREQEERLKQEREEKKKVEAQQKMLEKEAKKKADEDKKRLAEEEKQERAKQKMIEEQRKKEAREREKEIVRQAKEEKARAMAEWKQTVKEEQEIQEKLERDRKMVEEEKLRQQQRMEIEQRQLEKEALEIEKKRIEEANRIKRQSEFENFKNEEKKREEQLQAHIEEVKRLQNETQMFFERLKQEGSSEVNGWTNVGAKIGHDTPDSYCIADLVNQTESMKKLIEEQQKALEERRRAFEEMERKEKEKEKEEREKNRIKFVIPDDDTHSTSNTKDLFPLRTSCILKTLPVNTSISLGCASYSFILLNNGNVYNWGQNDSNQLGHGHMRPVYTPTLLKNVRNVLCAAGTANHIGYITSSGCFIIPNLFATEQHYDFVAVDASDYFVLLDRSGRVFTLDMRVPRPALAEVELSSFLPNKVTSVATGRNTYLLLSSGEIYSVTTKRIFQHLPPMVAIAAGETHYLALANTGHVYAWGTNNDGECGLGWAPEEIDEPTPVKFGLHKIVIVGVAAGSKYSMALSDAGEVYSWGWGEFGKLGHGSGKSLTMAEKIPNLTNIISIACFKNHSMAIQGGTGNIYSWGCGEHGRLGEGLRDQHFFSPTVVRRRHFEDLAKDLQHVIHWKNPFEIEVRNNDQESGFWMQDLQAAYHWTTHRLLYSAEVNAFIVSEKFVLVWLAWGGSRANEESQDAIIDYETRGSGLFSWLPREILCHILSFLAGSVNGGVFQ